MTTLDPRTVAVLKEWVPRPIKQAARTAWQRLQWRRALRALADLPRGKPPGRALLVTLSEAWGNEGFTADLDYLATVAEFAAVTPGPVLECGSGLTTVLLGALAGRRRVPVWALEHDAAWQRRVAAALREYRTHAVRLCLAPLRDYGDFTWYDPPRHLMPSAFELVVCDGPPDNTPGGRFGLLPVMGDSWPVGAVILLDDVARDSEQEAVRRWGRMVPIHVVRRDLAGGPMAEITRC
jgi:hypothetical protein